MNDNEENLRVQLIEALLDYIEGRRTFRSVIVFGINAYNLHEPYKDQYITKIVNELNDMGNQLANGKNFFKEEIKETFTTFLENLVPK
ncbi:MAG TPA: hypothetical protein VE090_02735 [Methylomirabilota bacterium]|nr:hypothetical protein [Methylomirabilota bacterium]